MRGRVALSDPKIVKKINDHYVPAVGEHMILTQGPLSNWWNEFVPQANPQFRGGSTQGYYVLGADGTGLLWDNYLPRLGEFLDRGLARFRENPPHWAERGQQGHLDGEFDIDTATTKIVRFRAFVDSQAWDHFQGRRNFSPPPGKYRLVTAIIEAQDDLAQQITPEPANTGDYYLRSQVRVGE